MTTKLNYRKFLNNDEHSGTAFVAFRIIQNKSGYLDAEFTIKDCSDEATLDFYVPQTVRAGKPKIENARAKIARLKEAIDEFDKAFEAALIERDKSRKRKTRKK